LLARRCPPICPTRATPHSSQPGGQQRRRRMMRFSLRKPTPTGSADNRNAPIRVAHALHVTHTAWTRCAEQPVEWLRFPPAVAEGRAGVVDGSTCRVRHTGRTLRNDKLFCAVLLGSGAAFVGLATRELVRPTTTPSFEVPWRRRTISRVGSMHHPTAQRVTPASMMGQMV
jgi:hypothetical protein